MPDKDIKVEPENPEVTQQRLAVNPLLASVSAEHFEGIIVIKDENGIQYSGMKGKSHVDKNIES